MVNQKKGFVLYFDSYPVLAQLPPEQLGWLLLALYRYADEVWRDPDFSQEEILDIFPKLTDQSRMAFGFLAANLCRDAKRWLERQARASGHSAARAPAPPAKPISSKEAQTYQQDFDLVNGLMQHMKQEMEAAALSSPAP